MNNRKPAPGKIARPPVLGVMDAAGWPLDAPPFAAIVHSYGGLVHRTAQASGVRPADVTDCAQIVWGRLWAAVVDGRADPRGHLGGWLIRTTTRVSMDFCAKHYAKREVLAPDGDLEAVMDPRIAGDHVTEALDVDALACRVLDKLSPEQQEMFLLAFVEQVPMPKIIEHLDIGKSAAYARREAARKAFAREWEAVKLGGAAAVAAFALFSVEELLAAWRASRIMPEGLGEVFSHPLVEPVGPDSAGPESTVRVATTVASAARASASLLGGWQNVAGAALLVLVGPDVYPRLHPLPDAMTSSRGDTVAIAEPSAVTVSDVPRPLALLSQAPIPSARPTPVPPSRLPRAEIQTELVDSARALLDAHQPRKALALLARVTAPDLAAARDELRARALRDQAGATHP